MLSSTVHAASMSWPVAVVVVAFFVFVGFLMWLVAKYGK